MEQDEDDGVEIETGFSQAQSDMDVSKWGLKVNLMDDFGDFCNWLRIKTVP
jgi:hypothetical protein